MFTVCSIARVNIGLLRLCHTCLQLPDEFLGYIGLSYDRTAKDSSLQELLESELGTQVCLKTIVKLSC